MRSDGADELGREDLHAGEVVAVLAGQMPTPAVVQVVQTDGALVCQVAAVWRLGHLDVGDRRGRRLDERCDGCAKWSEA